MSVLTASNPALTIDDIRTGLASRTLTATALAEEHYTRIAAEDGPIGKGINSFLALSRERALAKAAAIDDLAALGDPLPLLAGVPVGIKDVLTMQGSPASAGSKILAGYMPPYDATAVKKLDAAGAVLLGKLNCDEFAMGSSNENSAYGPVATPALLIASPAAHLEVPPRLSPRALQSRLSAPIPADRSASRQPSAASSASCPPMAESAATA